MRTDRGDRLKSLDDATAFDYGETAAFTIKTETGKQLRVHCPIAEIGDIIFYLATVAREFGATREIPKLAPHETRNYLVPIPAEGIGFQFGQTRDTVLLVVGLSGFDLAFELSSSNVATLADDFARIARTLSAGGQIQ